jgi:hypothetical protein
MESGIGHVVWGCETTKSCENIQAVIKALADAMSAKAFFAACWGLSHACCYRTEVVSEGQTMMKTFHTATPLGVTRATESM